MGDHADASGRRPGGRFAPADGLHAIGLLQDPARAKLYRHLVATGVEISRQDAADVLGVPRSVAGFHLDKLATAGLLAVSYRRRSGRTGPGAGRPAKLYRPAHGEVSASMPPRSYDTAARLLAETVEQAGADAVLSQVARRDGAERGRAARAEAGAGADPSVLLGQALEREGYEPAAEGSVLRLQNCPFHPLIEDFEPLVCAMNLALLEGLVSGLEAVGCWTTEPDSGPGRCCVMLRAADASNDKIR